jgi:hemoglobin
MKDEERADTRQSSSDPKNTRRDVLVQGATLTAGAVAAASCTTMAAANSAQGSQAPQPGADQSLYTRLGGIFAIAAVVDYFSDQIIQDPVAGARSANPQLREWHTQQLGRLPGLKFMRTLWVASIYADASRLHQSRAGKRAREPAHFAGRVRRRRCGAVALARSFQRARARERRSPGRIRGAQGRSHARLARRATELAAQGRRASPLPCAPRLLRKRPSLF